MKYFRTGLSSSGLLVAVVSFMMIFANASFIGHAWAIFDGSVTDMLFTASLLVLFGAVTVILLSFLCYRHTTKPVLILVLLGSAFSAYFMDNYGTMMTPKMMSTVLETNYAEMADLFSFKLILYVVLLGVIPAWLVYRTKLTHATWRGELWSRLKLLSVSVIIIVSVFFTFSDYYFSFFRENKTVRYYSNPGAYLYSYAKLAYEEAQAGPVVVKSLGRDARIPVVDEDRELVIMVVGETTRADHFSLNGYGRETNPFTSKIGNTLSFSSVQSCGTLTAVSVPCMFTDLLADDYDKQDALSHENVLDVLTHAGVNVLWLDNNSSSKGMAKRVEYVDYRNPENNPVCDIECRDVGMLAHLQEYIDSHPKGDIFIVLHQMGQHGPAYYKRYPAAFETYSPVCESNQLQSCSREEIVNAYDNSVRYTDYFLSQVIGLLKVNTPRFETALFYVSDHGESLGENGLYLHGLPNLIAPEEQRHVPVMMWIGDSMEDIDMNMLQVRKDKPYSHDNVFHTILGFMEINSSVYRQQLDMLYPRQAGSKTAKDS